MKKRHEKGRCEVTAEVLKNCLDGPLRKLSTLVVSSDPGAWLQRCDRVIEMRAEHNELRVDFVGSYKELRDQGHLELSEHREVQKEETSQEEPKKRKKLQVTTEEERQEGAVPLELYKHYFRRLQVKGSFFLRVLRFSQEPCGAMGRCSGGAGELWCHHRPAMVHRPVDGRCDTATWPGLLHHRRAGLGHRSLGPHLWPCLAHRGLLETCLTRGARRAL